jgi:hypothetical protein
MIREIILCIVILQYTYGADSPIPTEPWFGFVPALELIPGLVLLVFLWIAFVKVKDRNKKRWYIFILIDGLYSLLGSLVFSRNNPTGILLGVVLGLFYLLSFALRPDIIEEKT